MSGFNSEPHNEYHRGNRGRERYRGRRPYWGRGNGARRAEDEFDLSSEDGTGNRNERGRGNRRPWGKGRHWKNRRGEGLTTSDIRPLFPVESFVGQTAENYPGAQGTFTVEQRTSNERRSSNAHWKKGRGEGLTTSDIRPLFPVESFVERTAENYPGAQGTFTVEQRTSNERRSSNASSKAEQRNEGPAADRSVRVDQNRILDYLVKCHGGSCLVSDLRENHTLFEDTLTPEAVLQALRNCRNVKVLRNGNNLDGSVVKAFFRALRLCFQHRPPKPCKHQNCKHLHLCRDFLMDCCFMKHCVCSHDVDSQRNEAIVINCGVHIFSPDQQLSLIRCTNLMVCREHNSPEGCPNADSCFKLHICNAFVMNKCLLLDENCSEGHDPFSERNRTVLQLHEMERLPKETIFKMLLAFNRQPQRHTKYAGNYSETKEFKPANIRRRSEVEDENDETVTKAPYEVPVRPAAAVRPPATRNPNVIPFTEFMKLNIDSCDEEVSKDICDAFEEHSCNLRENCTDRHKSRTAYLWRVKLNGQWISLDKENAVIERAFSYPDIEEYWAMESIPDVQLHLKFEDMSSDSGPIQRLSTPSYVEVRDKVDATRWLWYWHNGSQWIPYGQSGEPPHLDILEAKYQRDPNLICCFEFGSTLYELDFAKMEQKNLRTHYARRVRRRPLYEERVEWAPHIRFNNEYHCDDSKLPRGWVPMDTESKDGTELVPLHSKSDACQRVAAEFFRTMDKSKHQIRRIYKVQNLDLWTHYETKKASIDKHMGGRETEVNVFHGTAEEGTARWICGVGFDQRMHGVNGTVYGKGAYFATTAKYSNGYTQPSSRRLRYMFYAKITIGRLAEGNGNLKRPPAIDPNNPMKGLYDSCANNVANPSIYVIFDNSQTYPDYLIEYRDICPDPVLDQSSLSQSQAYAQAFNRFSLANAAASQPTNVFSSYSQSPPPSNPPPFNPQPSSPPLAFNPQPSNPAPSNPQPSNPLLYSGQRPQSTSYQNSSTNANPSKKDSSCLVM